MHTKVLVVGASGFVGSAIIQAAAARRDMRPIACMRRAAPVLDHLGVQTRLCDAADPAALAGALDGVTHAINCVLGDRATMVAATRNLCEAARRVGLRRIVHLSSMEVYSGVVGVAREADELSPDTAYGRAKKECEAIVRDYIAAGGDAVVIRPGCVYGPGGEQWVGRIARWLLSGRLGDLGDSGEGYCNLTFNADLAQGAIAALITPGIAGETFNLADTDPGTWNQYFRCLGAAVGAPVRRISPRQLRLEATIFAPPLQIAKLVGRRVGLPPATFPEPITPTLFRLWRLPTRLDSTKADARLSFTRTPPQRGLALSAEWFRSQPRRR